MSAVTAQLPPGAARTTVAGLAAVELGEGPTVVLVPGYTGSKEDFSSLLPLLADRYRLVAVDQRGQHESPGPDDPAAYTVEALARDLLAVVAELGGPVHLVGHSFGGLVARQAVLLDPSAVRDLVLLGSGPAALGGQRAEVMTLMRPLLVSGGTPAVVEAMVALDPEPSATRDFQHARMLANSAVALLASGDALLTEPDRVAELAATGVRVLVAHGESDDAWAPTVQRDMARRLGAAYEIVPGSVHSPAAEAPEATAAVLDQFWFFSADGIS